ncbi:MAG TPA: GNAT family N-acetyltransferase [Solirubrobacterales bacterium]|nr:GNAT family N-acetyltransferase [Solirubrobacterales bacterium]
MDGRRAHLNLIDSSRQLFELDPGADVEDEPGWLLGAGSASHPAISNAAFRRDDGADPEELLARAREFFGARGRGFSVWGRDDLDEDRDLLTAADAGGLQFVYAMPEMTLGAPVEAPGLPLGAELRRLATKDQAEDYWRVAAASYASLGFPPEVFAGYTDHSGLLAGNVAAFLAYLDGEPVAIAMTIVSEDVAGIYWVGTLERARGKGLGRAVTAAATNAGFELGADLASLQASPMGKPIYEAMGYETVFEYRLLMSSPPQGA